jgi:hypothetical protein
MRPLSIAAIIASLLLPASAVAGPEGTFHVKGVNPDDGSDYTGTVKVARKGDVYRVVWNIGSDQTVGIGLGIRIVDGQMVAGPASDKDTGISIAYASGKTPGNATYTEFSDGTWRGVWAFKGYKTISTEEWIPTVRQIATKSVDVVKSRTKPWKAADVASEVDKTRTGDVKSEDTAVSETPIRVISSPLPSSVGPKS